MNPQTRFDGTPAVNPAAQATQDAGLGEVTRSLRVLARKSRDLAIDGGEVLERELAMAISISERLRDEASSPEALERARSGRLNRQIRHDAHRIVDLIADVGGVAAMLGVRFIEQFTDAPRPALTTEESPKTGPEPVSG